MRTEIGNVDWDVFISYASEERSWVRDHLYEPLMRCRTADGKRPRIFFDVEGIDVSQNWQQALSEAIECSRKVVPVYSVDYFDKPMCRWELNLCWKLDPAGDQRRLNPVLRGGDAEARIPSHVSMIQFLRASDAGWFERLCRSLQLEIEQEPTVLEFLDQPPAEMPVNNTLPPLRVRLGDGAASAHEEQVTVTCDGAQLRGTRTRSTDKGIATFDDLSLDTALPETALVAEANGCEPVRTRSFAVVAPEAAALPRTGRETAAAVLLPAAGRAVFFAGGQRLAVIDDDAVTVFDLQGRRQGDAVAVSGPLRLCKALDAVLVLVDWWGVVWVLGPDGTVGEHRVPAAEEALLIAGDAAFDGQRVYVGFWNGAIYSLAPGAEPQAVLQHSDGIAALAGTGESLLVADLGGQVLRCRGGRVTPVGISGDPVHMLRAHPGCVVAVGERQLYYIQLEPEKVFSQELPLAGAAGVYGDCACPVVLDAEGKGVRFDAGLRYEARFATAPGAVPVAADDAGEFCVLRHVDGTHSLLVRDRVVFTHVGGTLAVAGDGLHFALGSADGIRIVALDVMAAWMKGEGGGDADD